MGACLCIMHVLQPLLMLSNGFSLVGSSQASHLLLCYSNGMGLLQHVQLMLGVLNASSLLSSFCKHNTHFPAHHFASTLMIAWYGKPLMTLLQHSAPLQSGKLFTALPLVFRRCKP